LVEPPKAPTFYIFLPDWHLKQQMNFALLVFGLIAGDAGLEVKAHTRNPIDPKFKELKNGGRASRQSQSRYSADCFAEPKLALIHFLLPQPLMAIRALNRQARKGRRPA
jgi:hypothetical protein